MSEPEFRAPTPEELMEFRVVMANKGLCVIITNSIYWDSPFSPMEEAG